MQAVDDCLVTAVILLLARLANASANPSSGLLHALWRNRLAQAGPDRLLPLCPKGKPAQLLESNDLEIYIASRFE